MNLNPGTMCGQYPLYAASPQPVPRAITLRNLLFRKGKVGMRQVLRLSVAEKILPGLRLHLRIIGVIGIGPNKSLAIEPEISKEAFNPN